MVYVYTYLYSLKRARHLRYIADSTNVVWLIKIFVTHCSELPSACPQSMLVAVMFPKNVIKIPVTNINKNSNNMFYDVVVNSFIKLSHGTATQ